MMNNYTQYVKENIELPLKALPFFNTAVFCVACCERLIPEYRRFYKDNSFGNIFFIELCIEVLWNSILLKDINLDRLNQMKLKIISGDIIPSVDDNAGAVYALESCSTIYSTIEYIITKNSMHSVEVAKESLTNKEKRIHVGYISPEEEFKIVIADVLFKKELDIQREQLSILKDCDDISPELIQILRKQR